MTSHSPSGRKQVFALIGFVVLAFLAPAASVGISAYGWYRTLALPAWAPPGWVFGPVWTLLYLLMGIAAWGVWRRRGWGCELGLWVVQLALNAAWTPIFFGLHQPGWACVEIVALWVAIAVTVRAFRRVVAWAGWLMSPYLAWVTFATALNFAIWWLNR
jgi:tryptophan-rich sensory protein